MRVRFLVTLGHCHLRTESFCDYGSRAGFWRLLDLLDKFEVKAEDLMPEPYSVVDAAWFGQRSVHGHDIGRRTTVQ